MTEQVLYAFDWWLHGIHERYLSCVQDFGGWYNADFGAVSSVFMAQKLEYSRPMKFFGACIRI